MAQNLFAKINYQGYICILNFIFMSMTNLLGSMQQSQLQNPTKPINMGLYHPELRTWIDSMEANPDNYGDYTTEHDKEMLIELAAFILPLRGMSNHHLHRDRASMNTLISNQFRDKPEVIAFYSQDGDLLDNLLGNTTMEIGAFILGRFQLCLPLGDGYDHKFRTSQLSVFQAAITHLVALSKRENNPYTPFLIIKLWDDTMITTTNCTFRILVGEHHATMMEVTLSTGMEEYLFLIPIEAIKTIKPRISF